MLALPLITPINEHSAGQNRSDSPPPQAQTHLQRQQRQQRDEEKRLLQARSPLALLAADEAAIAQRKAAIRNFGASWIRPPGITKTLQSMIEEEVERREQEELERQERGILDLQAQQQLEEQPAEEEQDLDEEVPEANTFNEESMLEGSQIELEEAELTGVARDEENLGIEHERDLDDSVPEASYESFESDVEDSMARGSPQQPAMFDRARMLRAQPLLRSPGSMTLSSPQIESSFAASSPVRARATRHPRQS